MERTMKAAVVHRFGKPLTIEEVEVPRPGANDDLVKIEACGVCHTDPHAAEGDWPVKPALPLITGHEGVGHVVAVGADVSRVKEGDRVGIPWLHSAPAWICRRRWTSQRKARWRRPSPLTNWSVRAPTRGRRSRGARP